MMDIMVTICSAFYIIVEDSEQEARQKNLGEHILSKLERLETVHFEKMMKEVNKNIEGFEANIEKIEETKTQGKKLSKKFQAYEDFANMSVDGIIHMYRQKELEENED
jgi:hypothetical protein